ncbi:MAG: peptide-methionine (S)-S-oxide reductase MsrA [Leptospirillum sp.]
MPKTEKTDETQSETATLAGGCFWCLDAVFRDTQGVCSVVSGYTGGTTQSPTYREVCGGTTGHAEAVKITFDPLRISYRQILDIFFAIHDPTTLNRQGADTGTQYRSEIFYHSPGQKETALDLIRELSSSGAWSGRPIVTALSAAGPFHPAEDYHQDYFSHNSGQPYCQMVVRPKIEKFRKTFPEWAVPSNRP